MKKSFLCFFLALLLSACGFHLRGLVDVPTWISPIFISSHVDSKELVTFLKTQLEANNIQVRTNPSQASYWLIINSLDIQQQIVSIGASTNPRQYQLILRVGFELQTSKGEMVSPARVIAVNRQVTINNDRILGSNNEEAILVQEMKKEAVIQIINSLSRIPVNPSHAN